MSESLWSIWLVERPVVWERNRDMRVFGKPFSHPFLLLRDQHGKSRAEIHGARMDKCSGVSNHFLKRAAGHVFDYITGKTHKEGLVKAFTAVASPFFYPKGQFDVITQPFRDRSGLPQQKLAEGSQTDIMHKWQAVLNVLPQLPAIGRPFYRYASQDRGLANCQVILRQAMEKSGVFPQIPNLNYAQTGWTHPRKNAISVRHDPNTRTFAAEWID